MQTVGYILIVTIFLVACGYMFYKLSKELKKY